MRYRIIGVLALASLLLGGCGGDDTPRGNTLDDDDRTTTTESDDDPTTTEAAEPVSTRQILARLVVQVDDALRASNASARPCIVGPAEQCTGPALDAYTRLDDLAGALRFVLDGATNPDSDLYAGRAADDAVGLIDASRAVSDDAKAKSAAAQQACLPTPGAGCAEANAALDAALVELLKDTNGWRDFL
jgi:hypothetical protein